MSDRCTHSHDSESKGNAGTIEEELLAMISKRRDGDAKVLPEVAALNEELVSVRRHLHAHPELSFQEHNTAAFVAKKLREIGHIAVEEGVGKTGVVGVLNGAHAGPCIALRADMDALPIQETTGLPFASQNAGVMHACGHDGHVSMLLVAARVLASHRDKLHGSVKFMFQPAEEGFAGARAMIEDGVLEKAPRVDEVYGLHVWNYQPPGLVGVKHGPLMASSAKFDLTVTGKGGHGAVPEGTNDAVVAAAQLVLAMQTIVARNVSPLDSAVLTIGTINGGFGYNVIADKVVLTGTVRTFSARTQETVKKRMEDLCAGTSVAYGVKAELDYQYGYPVTENHSAEHCEHVRVAAAAVVGEHNVVVPTPTMAAEDMSYFLNKRPGCFFFLGSSPSTTELVPHHKSNFTLDEKALPLGASIFVQLVLNRIGSK